MKQVDFNSEKKGIAPILLYILAGFGAVCLVGLLAWGVFLAVRLNTHTPAPEHVSDVFETSSTTDERQVGNEEDDLPYTDFLGDEPLVVEWNKGAELLSRADIDALMRSVDPEYEKTVREKYLFVSEDTDLCSDESNYPEGLCDVFVYHAGTIQSPASLAEKPLYYLFAPASGLGIVHVQFIVTLDDDTGKFLLFEPEEYGAYQGEDLSKLGWLAARTKYIFSELSSPETILIPEQEAFLKKREDSRVGGITNIIEGTIEQPTGSLQFSDRTAGDVFLADARYYTVSPDGSTHSYELIPEFFQEPEGEEKEMYPSRYDVNIVWNNGNEAEDKYMIGGDIGRSGCGPGVLFFTSVVNNKDWFSESNLVQIGTSALGKPVYELSDKATNSHYKALFDFGYAAAVYLETGEPARIDQEFTDEDYQKFIDDTPLFFAKDYLGNWRSYRKAKYQTLAECGKPVVYLYPEREMDVRVEIEPNGGLTKVDPAYPSDGWFVRANPSGALYNYADQTNYPYLFWEGKASGFTFPEQGFVFAREAVPREMRSLLAATGLNKTETEDFMAFWEEKLMTQPYVFVTFASEQAFERSAPLRVTPQPDTVRRLFMYYEPLKERKDVEPLTIRPFERRGFTVVEWGGVLYGFEKK